MSEANDSVPKAAMDPTVNFHYFLISGLTVFLRTGSDVVESLTSNTLLITHDQKIRAKDIGRVQRALQMNLHKKMSEQEEKPVRVLDAIILNIAFLGEMSQIEFEADSMLEQVHVRNQGKES